MTGLSGRGHRPCHSAAPGSGPAGGQSPRSAPAPPMAGASRPPGRALACVVPGPAGLWGSVPRGRGKRAAFPVPARRGDGTSTASMAGAIAPAIAPHRDQDRPGSKAPGQRPTRHQRALACVALAGRVLIRPWSPTGRGNALRFGVRPERQAAFATDRQDVPLRQALGMLFQNPADGTRASEGPRRAGPGQPWHVLQCGQSCSCPSRSWP